MVLGKWSKEDIEKFWSKVEKDPDTQCWNWKGSVRKSSGKLHGFFHAYDHSVYPAKRVQHLAHKFSYQLAYEKDPDTKYLLHTCKNRFCVNPAHLEDIDSNKRGTNDPLEHFYKFVDKTSSPLGCHLWTGGLDPKGYGVHYCNNTKGIPAHRYIYEMLVEPLIPGLVVMHKCDVRNCVNSAHLKQATYWDNTIDMYNKSRQNNLFGEKHANSKLTDEIVIRLRTSYDEMPMYETLVEIANRYSLNFHTIYQALAGNTWKHLNKKYPPLKRRWDKSFAS